MTRQLWTYAGIAYGITWTILFGLYVLHTHGVITRDELNIYYSFGALGPFLGAIVAAKISYGTEGVRRLFATLAPVRLERRSLLLALSPLAFFLIGLLVHFIITGVPFSFEMTRKTFGLSTTASYLGWAVPFVVYAFFEELGWRGFALPHLQERYSALASTAMLALVWALWHAPMFLFRFDFSVGITIGFFFGIFVGAIILTSIFNLSRGSVLAATIFHLTNNVSSAFDREYIVATVSTGFVAVAICLLAVYGWRDLADTPRVGNGLARSQGG